MSAPDPVPVVHVDVAADGSTHVSVSDRHKYFDRATHSSTIERPGPSPIDLTPWQLLHLQYSDTLVLGDIQLIVSLKANDVEMNPR